MNRRHFLQFSGLGISTAILPKFAFANSQKAKSLIALNIPTELKDNPLLTFGKSPNFADIKPAHIEPAISFLVKDGKEKIEKLTNEADLTWQGFYVPLEEVLARMDYAWNIVRTLNSVANNPEQRKAYQNANKVMNEFESWYGMHENLYKVFKMMKASKAYLQYNKAQQTAINNALLEFELSGVGLEGDKKKRYAELSERLSTLRTTYSDNVLDASKWGKTITDKALLRGIPESDLKAAEKLAKANKEEGWRFNLSQSSYWTIADFAENRELREEFYKAFVTRASEVGTQAGKFDNTPVIKEILAVRHEMANLLGYKNHAEYALVKRMASNPKEVMDFYNGLLGKVRELAIKENDGLIAYGKDKLGIADPQAWDYAYIMNKQKEDLYKLDQEAMRAYFPVDRVMAGMFEINRRLFGITIKEKKGVPVWHKDVKYYEVFDKKGEKLGATYVDLYSREGKRSGAWKSNFVVRRQRPDGSVELPVTLMAANFTPPADGVALLTQENVVTLFHEFGHAIHQIIGKVSVASVSGTNGVPRDAVEFPSQLLEYWVFDKKSIPLFSGHYKTGEPLPEHFQKQIAAAKNHLAARKAVRQAELGVADMRLYNEYDPNEPNFLERIQKEVDEQVSVIKAPDYLRQLNSFTHIFSGGYGAGYYGYLWSDVLSADVFARFEKDGILNSKTGQAYVEKFLGKGGSEAIMPMYVDFMGRKPDPNAFMKQLTGE